MLQPIATNTLLDGLDFEKALGKMEVEANVEAGYKASRAFYNGNHWQDGLGWIGPSPIDNNPQAGAIMDKFKRSFVSKNLIAECVDRERNAVIGRQPNWTITVRRTLKKIPAKVPDPANPQNQIVDPSGALVDESLTPEEQALIDEAAAVLTPWWDQRQVLKALQTCTTKRINMGKGAVRPFVPQDSLSESGKAPKLPLDQAIMLVHVDTPEPEDTALITKLSSMKQFSIVRITEKSDDSGEDLITLELSALTNDGRTIIASLTKDSPDLSTGSGDSLTKPVEAGTGDATPNPVDISEPLNLGGRLAVHVMEGRPLTTEQVKQNQKLLNLALTMCGHNVVEAGFSERVITNAEMPGKFVPDPTAEGGKRFVPDPLPRGAGVSTNLVGLQYVDEAGATHVLTPGVHFREPAPVDTFVKTKDLALRDVYEEVHQMHALISGDATASGASRVQALADFVMNCLEIKENVDTAGQYTLETALAFAAHMAGSPGKFASLRINFDCKIDTGPLSPQERTALQAEVAARLRSRESYMLLTGQADPQAELVQIKRDEALFPAPAPVPIPGTNPPNPNNPNPAGSGGTGA